MVSCGPDAEKIVSTTRSHVETILLKFHSLVGLNVV
jgi:hypothetical protein